VASPLGEKIRALRIEKGFSLEQLAQMTDSSKSYLWELENRAQANPSLDKLNRLAIALSVTSEFLVSGTDQVPEKMMTDEVFFRKYQELPEEQKKMLLKIVDAWKEK
jgi:transcriptional regulator with XRE-family HTH domain